MKTQVLQGTPPKKRAPTCRFNLLFGRPGRPVSLPPPGSARKMLPNPRDEVLQGGSSTPVLGPCSSSSECLKRFVFVVSACVGNQSWQMFSDPPSICAIAMATREARRACPE
eukprot:5125736-Alexandrium_andersonii.AAC.1